LLVETLRRVSADDAGALDLIDERLAEYGADPRLHFLKGSVLAALQRYPEAQDAIRRAIDLAPGYDIARFQLGLLEFTSGNAASAEMTWRPLQRLPGDSYLRLFATGLLYLGRDDFVQAVEMLREGIARNTDNPAMNRDMQMVIDEAVRKCAGDTPASELDGEEPVSAVHLLLQKFDKNKLQ
jgi:tetratricopeptide (TPR) repeat protein